MTDQILKYMEHAGNLVSLSAVAVIVVGFLLAATRYVLRYRTLTAAGDFKPFKVQLGGALTLALEMLVLSDVIDTITETPTYQSLAVLAFLVVARTVLSWSLILETEGRWPWQPSAEDQAHA